MDENKKKWIYELTRDEISGEKLVKGYIKNYVLRDMSMSDVKKDILKVIGCSGYECDCYMINLTDALQWYVDREESRTLTEIHNIVECVRNNIPVQVDYYDEDLDEDPFVVRSKW